MTLAPYAQPPLSRVHQQTSIGNVGGKMSASCVLSRSVSHPYKGMDTTRDLQSLILSGQLGLHPKLNDFLSLNEYGKQRNQVVMSCHNLLTKARMNRYKNVTVDMYSIYTCRG